MLRLLLLQHVPTSSAANSSAASNHCRQHQLQHAFSRPALTPPAPLPCRAHCCPCSSSSCLLCCLQDLPYGSPGVLGLAATWPQAAGALPDPAGSPGFDWEGDRPLGLPMEDLVIYEMHVRGFTQHHTSGVEAPGTFAGVVERLDYLAGLGVNAIELMPIHEFNELEYYQARGGGGG